MVKSGLKTEIIFLTLHSNQDLFRSAMDLGCKGYILKDSAVQEVVAGIHAVGSGRPYISSAITTDLLQSRNRPQASNALTSNLTPTELRIMGLIAQGKTSKEIGAELSIHYSVFFAAVSSTIYAVPRTICPTNPEQFAQPTQNMHTLNV
jgi:DNA-binding NarL/FixJ family response regulator